MVQQFKKENLTRTKVKNNILKIWAQANENDKFDWYKQAHIFATKIAHKHNVPTSTICGVIAALSPMVTWEYNQMITLKAIEMYLSGLNYTNMPCLKSNAKKAFIILSGTAITESEILEVLKGNKVSAFFLNILYPERAISITIDRHALSIALGKWITTNQVRSMTAKQYKFFEDCYRWTAAKLDVNPLLLQSTTWVVWRRIKKQYK